MSGHVVCIFAPIPGILSLVDKPRVYVSMISPTVHPSSKYLPFHDDSSDITTKTFIANDVN